MTERRCKNCTSYKWVEGKTGECRFHPPKPFMVAIPVPNSSLLGPANQPKAMQIQTQFTAAYPMVKEDLWCKTGYEPKVRKELDELFEG